MTKPRFAAVAMLALGGLAACGESATAPTPPLDLTGAWRYSITDATGGGISCDVTNIILNFASTGGQLTGTVAAGGGGNVGCVQVSNGLSNTVSFSGTGALAAVSLAGSAVGFSIPSGNGAWPHTGTATASTMSGTVTMFWRFGGNPIPLTGTWAAVKQ